MSEIAWLRKLSDFSPNLALGMWITVELSGNQSVGVVEPVRILYRAVDPFPGDDCG
jgi:hypothetical protein